MIRVSLVAWYHVSLGKRKKEVSKLEKEEEGSTYSLFILKKEKG
jgi:hypothetical protein